MGKSCIPFPSAWLRNPRELKFFLRTFECASKLTGFIYLTIIACNMNTGFRLWLIPDEYCAAM